MQTVNKLTQRIKSRLRRMLAERDPRAVHPPKDFCASSYTWQKSFCTYLPLDPPHLIQRHVPNLLPGTEKSVDWEFSTRLEYQSPATFVVTLPQGRLAGHAVITPDDYLLADVSIEATVTPENAERHSIFKNRVLPRPRKIAGRLIALSSAHCESSYFHWMFDLLPRLDILQRSGFKTLPTDTFAVNSFQLPFQQETLRSLGLHNIVESQSNPHLQADCLVVPSLPGVMGNMPLWACEFLRREFLRPLNSTKRDTPRRIYISRKNAAFRRLLNEDVIVEVLKEHWFEVFALEGLTFQEQVELFQKAEIVVAPHGAGLTNLIFCNPNTKVIELFSPLYVNGCYWALCEMLNLNYHYMLGNGERPSQDLDHSGGGADYEIDLEKFRTIISKLASG